MKKVLFVVSHLSSGVGNLIITMNKHPRIKIWGFGATYTNPTDLDPLFAGTEGDPAGIYYGDYILFNEMFACKQLYDLCHFVYLVRPPRPTLNSIMVNEKYTKENANSHYCFRIRRIYEMAKKTSGAVLLTWNDLRDIQGLRLVQEYLGFKQPFEWNPVPAEEYPDTFLPHELEEAEEYYEKYLFLMKKLDLRAIR